MCGIFGYYSTDGKPLERDNITAAVHSMTHRGPDDASAAQFLDGTVALGHTRLAIQDMSEQGRQPMVSDDGRFCLVFNGELYNFQRLRGELERHGCRFRSTCDTEVLLHAYGVWGKGCLHRLNGMFAFAIWDRQKRELFAARDRLGLKPLYWALTDGALYFASEIKALFAAGVDNAPDWPTLHNPWHFVVGPATGFAGIQKLKPGQCLHYGPAGLTRETWWSLDVQERAVSEDTALAELDELLHDSVRLRMIADVPVGAFLSGGLDSSLVTSLMGRVSGEPPRTFTISFSEEDKKFEAMPDDAKYARRVAKQLGCVHQEIVIQPDIVNLLPKMVQHLDEPLADPAAINAYLISLAAREQGVKVLLNGMGGDEVFGGYRKQLACLLAGQYQTLPSVVRKGVRSFADLLPVASRSRGFKSLRWAKRFLSFAELDPTQRFLQSDGSLSPDQYRTLFTKSADYPYDSLECVQAQKRLLDSDGSSYLSRMCQRDTQFFLPDHNLLYTDKATMAASIEGRQPLTDHRLVEWAFSLPDALRIHGRVQKYILKKVAEPYLDRKIIYRPKAPFAAPLRSWVRGELKEMVGDVLSRDAVVKRGLYTPDAVSHFIEEDRAGIHDHSQLIWTLLTRELWFQTFIDDLPRPEVQPEVRFYEANDAEA